MPELPDVELYVEHLTRRLSGRTLERVRVASPFLLRTVSPPLSDAEGRTIRGFRRLGKRVVFELEEGPFLVVHLMVAGRFHWKDASRAPVPKKVGLAAFDVPGATLLLTEASPKKRAALHVVATETELAALSRGGLEPLAAGLPEFAAVLRSESHTVKRALTDPRLFSGIGNAYSDEILHAARLSPFKPADGLDDDATADLYGHVRGVLGDAVATAREVPFAQLKDAKRSGMRVHGRTGQPCPVCGTTVAEVSFADSSLQYCPTCQTGGKPLADRRMSKLLK